jgi:DNA-binding NarL/FixJ family response regulator
MVRHALGEALVRTPGVEFEVLEAGSVQAAREILASQDIDLLLLDLHMPGMDGPRSLLALRSQFPSVAVLVVSANEDAQVVRQSMEFGAVGFLPKSAPFAAIGEAVKAVLAGDMWFATVEPGAPAAEAGPLAARVAELTPQQYRVFVLLAQGKLNKEIAFDLAVTEATVKAHVTQVLQKLGVHSRTQAALLAQRFDSPAAGREPKR